MRSREDAARRFGTLVGWQYAIGPRNLPGFWVQESARASARFLELPDRDGDCGLSIELAFVGGVAEAVGAGAVQVYSSREEPSLGSQVRFWIGGQGWRYEDRLHPDLVHAALLAGVATLEAKGGTT